MGEKLNNLIAAGKDNLGEILVQEATPVLITEMLKGTAIEGITQAAGVVVPRLGNLMLTYKQKKLERNFEIYLSQLIKKQDEINARLKCLEEERRKDIQKKYFGLIADYASESKQEEKIELMVNGFANIAGGVIDQADVVLMYYDTIDQLNMLDIWTLRTYMPDYINGTDEKEEDDILSSIKDYTLDYGQQTMVKEKLVRLGLLVSRNDLDMDENIKNIAQYLEDVSKGKKNPKLKRLKHIRRIDSYKITSYGVNLFHFFSEIIEKLPDKSVLSQSE